VTLVSKFPVRCTVPRKEVGSRALVVEGQGQGNQCHASDPGQKLLIILYNGILLYDTLRNEEEKVSR
jgi:hypothetical protein